MSSKVSFNKQVWTYCTWRPLLDGTTATVFSRNQNHRPTFRRR